VLRETYQHLRISIEPDDSCAFEVAAESASHGADMSTDELGGAIFQRTTEAGLVT